MRQYRWKRGTAGLMAGAAMLMLAGCSEANEQGASEQALAVDTTSPMMVSTPEEDEASAEIAGRPALPANLPRIAYNFGYSFRLPSAEISSLMRRHADRCESQGPAVCYIVGMGLRGNADREDLQGTLQLAVASSQARAFGAALEAEAEDAGAEQVSASIASEELSKQMVDTEARIRARSELRDRLMEVLQTRRGTVQELVEAERSVAQVNEEIDQARSWLEQMRGRVAFRSVTVSYESDIAPASDFWAPVRSALGSLGSIMGTLVALLIFAAAVGMPLAAGLFGIHRLRRRFGWGISPAES